MKTNKLDNNIKQKLTNRTFTPSASAWERLSAQLDEQPQPKKRGWFFYIGYAASILVLISIGIYLFSDDNQEIIPKTIIVNAPIDTITVQKKIDEIFNEVPIEEAIVNTEKSSVKEQKVTPKKEIETVHKKLLISKTSKELKTKNVNLKEDFNQANKFTKNTITIVNQTEKKAIIKQKEESVKKEKIKNTTKTSIKINSEDLLYAVTHSKEEVKAYYAKYDVSRDDILKTIKTELKKSNLKVNPETILAEVERNINDDDFQNNFLKSLKKKISNIATAIASRNH